MSAWQLAAYRPEGTLEQQLADCLRAVLGTALAVARGNQCKAAAALGIHRNTLARQCMAVGIRPETFRTRKKPVRSDVGDVMSAIGATR